MRHRNHGLRKRCRCKWKGWSKCGHEWHVDYKPRGGTRYRLSLDAELGRHVDSKTEAQQEAAKIIAAILDGTFVRAADRRRLAGATTVLPTPDAITFRNFGQLYLERHCKTSGKKTWMNDAGMLNRLAAFVLPQQSDDARPFGDKVLGTVTEDDIEVFFADLRRQQRAASTRNKYAQLCRAMFRWGVKRGYLTRNPIADSETLRREKMAQRKRRLEPDALDGKGKLQRPGEERRLLEHAPAHLQRLIIAAIETCCRRGELLSLTWGDVDVTKRELRIRAENAKDREQRILPISSRLAAVLEMVRTDPAGREYPGTAFVFGELGRRLKTIKKSWETTVLKAHGHEPEWTGKGTLSAASRAQLRAIDLHFHDLRHEAGSGLIEKGWPVHHVQEMLGHASLEQTSTYLNVTRTGLQESMRRFETAGIHVTPVSHGAAIEHPPVCHEVSGNDPQPRVN